MPRRGAIAAILTTVALVLLINFKTPDAPTASGTDLGASTRSGADRPPLTFIPDETLLEALAAKEPFAHYMTTQLCFDPDAISGWIAARRAEGFRLPVQIGVAGAVEPHRLLAISARIGVRDSARFLVKNAGFVGRLVRSGGFYRPDRLLDALAPLFADPIADVRWVHLYTFNQVAATESWRARFLADRLLAQPAQLA